MSRNKQQTYAAVLVLVAITMPLMGTFGFTQENPKARSSSKELSSATKRIVSQLNEPISMRFPVPFDDVLKYIQNSTKKGRNDPGIPLYIDPRGLQEVQKSLTSPVTIDLERAPLKDALERVLSQLNLGYIVKDDVVFISSRNRIAREMKETGVLAADAMPATKAVLAKLEEPVSMSFANETPLEDIVKYVEQATKKGPADPGIKILLDPNGLREVEKSANSTIQIDLQGVPLKTTLRLLLKQLDLAYIVKDGALVISSTTGVQKLKEKASQRAD
ncbi:MAG TPA: STN domain-containing protein [Isosphaeraceae bacterium]|nr:STN domain-containing protein [Isosphaeraceae bacterium]